MDKEATDERVSTLKDQFVAFFVPIIRNMRTKDEQGLILSMNTCLYILNKAIKHYENKRILELESAIKEIHRMAENICEVIGPPDFEHHEDVSKIKQTCEKCIDGLGKEQKEIYCHRCSKAGGAQNKPYIIQNQNVEQVLGRGMMAIKNCYSCTHLEWMEAEEWDPKGFICHHINYKTDAEEDKHLAQMESEEYLKYPKKCCELKKEKHIPDKEEG